MKKITTLLVIAAIAIFMSSCNEDRENLTSTPGSSTHSGKFQNNPAPNGHIPPATVKLIAPLDGKFASILADGEPPTLLPDQLTAQLLAGQSVCENKTLHLPPQVLPAQGDILFSFDLTGSMGEELTNVQNNSINIMTSIRGLITDSRFGVISHMDYPAYYDYCGYASTYGDSFWGDYPYMMNQSITASTTDVSTSIYGLMLGAGSDGPEDYTRVFHETWNDPSIGYRSGAKKFVVAFLDAVPHDCNYDWIIGGTGSTGTDPGRNGLAGDDDDLKIIDQLDLLKANNITPIIIYSGDPYDFPLWQAYATRAGGNAFQINYDGTIPDGTDIATYITSLISGSIQSFGEVTLQACDPAYAGWLTTLTPASYNDVVLGEPLDLAFNLCITVPEGTDPGQYCFDVCATGDGAVLARQSVCITVIATSLDIKPTSCPNPLNTKDNGKLPVAILGSANFDVSKIDLSTIRLAGVAPVNNSIEDVAGPFTGIIDDCYDCTTAGADGYADLSLKFSVQSVVTAIGTVDDRACVLLTLTASLKPEYGGTSFQISDIVRIQKR